MFDPGSRQNALAVVVLDLLHLRDQIGPIQQAAICSAAGQHQFDALGPGGVTFTATDRKQRPPDSPAPCVAADRAGGPRSPSRYIITSPPSTARTWPVM